MVGPQRHAGVGGGCGVRLVRKLSKLGWTVPMMEGTAADWGEDMGFRPKMAMEVASEGVVIGT